MIRCLTEEELQGLTGLVKPCAQARELDHLGIPYRTRRDGTIVVLEAAIMPSLSPAPRKREPVLHLP